VAYQRPTFVTPPFPAISPGTPLRARAAEVLTAITATLLSGRMSQFAIKKNSFWFRGRRASNMTFQWATYRDAASRAACRDLGGIHPPGDDIPGRVSARRSASAYASHRLFRRR